MEPVFDTRRISAIALAALLAALIGAARPGEPCRAEENPTPPRMALSSPVFDAGEVERGAKITHEFTFRNSGGSDLVILSTKAG